MLFIENFQYFLEFVDTFKETEQFTCIPHCHCIKSNFTEKGIALICKIFVPTFISMIFHKSTCILNSFTKFISSFQILNNIYMSYQSTSQFFQGPYVYINIIDDVIIIVCNFIIIQIKMKPPVYVVKPRNIFKHSFNKYQLDKPTTRESQNQEVTDYFNYGFNEDTMNIYAKLVKRTIQTLDFSLNPNYTPTLSNLTRLNDQTPMDFGGFCNFFNTSLLKIQNDDSFYDGDRFVQYFVFLLVSKKTKPENYPLIEFVKKMYPDPNDNDNTFCQIVNEISQNLQANYQEMLKKLIAMKQPEKKALKPDKKDKDNKQKDNKDYEPEKFKEKQKPTTKKEQVSSESDSDDDSDSSSQSNHKKTRKIKKKRSHKKSRSRSKSKRNKKQKGKERHKKKSTKKYRS